MSGNPMLSGLAPMHPGELLRDVVLPALGRPKKEIAALLGVSRQMLYAILEERAPVTPNMALRLGKLCGNGATLWLNLQRAYDLRRQPVKQRDPLCMNEWLLSGLSHEARRFHSIVGGVADALPLAVTSA